MKLGTYLGLLHCSFAFANVLGIASASASTRADYFKPCKYPPTPIQNHVIISGH